jgi:transcription initiation factor TFIID subunit TAF12
MAARTAVVAGTATAVSGRVQRRQAARYDQQDAQQQQQYQQQQQQYEQPAPPPAPEDDTSAKIENLVQLHNQGAITDEEFAAAKAKALGI